MAIPVPHKYVADFENLGFGMFVHWGLYSQLGRGEWVMNREQIPYEEYKHLKDTFTAKDFDPKEWARIAKAAGARYITLTSRHHEGFSLFDTMGLNDYDAPHSPAGRDLIREFVDACREAGLMPVFYFPTLDWSRPEYHTDFKAYTKYIRDSVEILCTRYGKIGGLWFDGNWSKPDADWEEDALYALIRRHQPEAIIVNNTGLSKRGKVGNKEIDSVTYERGRPAPMDREGMEKYIAAEMCETLNAHWGIGYGDVNYKSLPELIETFCACRKVGANFLLNVGPTGDGAIHPLQKAMLLGIGEWLGHLGDGKAALYEAKPCGITAEGKDFGLRLGNKLYFFVHNLTITGDEHVTLAGEETGLGGRVFAGVPGKVRSIRWTDQDESLAFTQSGDTLTVNCTGYPYGKHLVVRIAEAEIE